MVADQFISLLAAALLTGWVVILLDISCLSSAYTHSLEPALPGNQLSCGTHELTKRNSHDRTDGSRTYRTAMQVPGPFLSMEIVNSESGFFSACQTKVRES